MITTLRKRCIRRWTVEFKSICDSKVSLHWRKHHLRGYIREAALTMACCMVERMAENNAKFDYDGTTIGWSPEFAAWYDERRERYLKEAWDYLNEEATNDEIDEQIAEEIDCWND